MNDENIQGKCPKCSKPVRITPEMRAAIAETSSTTDGYLCDECLLAVVRAAARKRPLITKSRDQ